MATKTLLGIELPTESKSDIREKTLKLATDTTKGGLVMSLNPEIFIHASEHKRFKEVAAKAQIKIVDGVGVVAAARMKGLPVGDRYHGVDFMDDAIQMAAEHSLRVMLIGGMENVAEEVVDCYRSQYPALNITGLMGIADITKPTQEEEEHIFSIVTDTKPHLVFLAFGSPAQELWYDQNRDRFGSAVCAGVGGAFDFLSGRVPRAPLIMRTLGLEWLFRLIVQPWRIKRQLRLLKFISHVLRDL